MAVEELLRIYPGFSLQIVPEECRKWNNPDELIERWVESLRKAGVPEEPIEQA